MAENKETGHRDTIVIGAGIAGLACASRLFQARKTKGVNHPSLQILEARNRIGGRIGSVYVKECRLDTGANWIHGTGTAENPNPLMEILPHKRYRSLRGTVLFQAQIEQSKNVQSDGECCKCVIQEQERASETTTPTAANTGEKMSPGTNLGSDLVVPADMAGLISSSSRKVIGEVQAEATTVSPDKAKHTSILQALQNTTALPESFEAVPSKYHGTLSALFQGVETMEAAPLLGRSAEPERPESKPGVSLLEYAVDNYEGEQAFLQDGYTAIVDEIARPLVEASAILLEAAVKRIDWTTNPILVETSQGTYTAREVVCTIPLGVLKVSDQDTLFVPPLPADKREAIGSLGFGTLDKVFSIYSSPWWEEEPYASIVRKGFVRAEGQSELDSPDSFQGFTSELSGVSIGHDGAVSGGVYRLAIINLYALTGQPVLCAFVSCKNATLVENLEDEVVNGLVHRTLSQWFGKEVPKPDAVHVTRWAQDPFSQGSYSHMITGVSEVRHKEVLQQPLVNNGAGVLRFAGEHCSHDHFAMVHGALSDGWRVADAILQG